MKRYLSGNLSLRRRLSCL